MRGQQELFEAYEYLMLETEQRAAWLLNNFGSKVAQRFVGDFNAGNVPGAAKTAMGFDHLQQIKVPQDEYQAKEMLHEIAKAVIDYLMGFDPTPNKAYARWIVQRYIDKKQPQALEDVNQLLRDQLAVFAEAARSRRINGNIDAYKTFSELYQAVEPFLTGKRETSGKKDRKANRDTSVDTRKEKLWEGDPMLAQTDIVLDNDDYMILIPKTPEAAKYFGDKTNWCTTVGSYRSYADQGPLYIILRREDGTRWQFHFESHQFMDVNDRPIDLDEFIDTNPQVFEAIGPNKFFEEAARPGREHWRSKISLKHFSPEMMAGFPVESLAYAVHSMADLKKMPKEKGQSEEMFVRLVAIWCSNRQPLSTIEGQGGPVDVLKWFAKKDIKTTDRLLGTYPALLMMLPESEQTDERKITASHYVGKSLSQYVPEPWPEPVKQLHYDTVVEHPGDIPEKYRNSRNMMNALAEFPDEVEKYLDWMNDAVVTAIIQHNADKPNACKKVLESVPPTMVSKNAVSFIMSKIKELRKISYETRYYTKAELLDHKRRDSERLRNYLSVIADLPEKFWPGRNAHRLLDMVIAAKDDFSKLPEHYQTPERYADWIAQHPDELRNAPADMVSERAVERAIGRLYSQNKVSEVLAQCDPEVVKPEWVAEALSRRDMTMLWHGIPDKYMTRSMLDALMKRGDLPFNSKWFTPEYFTPENIQAVVKKIPQKHKVLVTKKYPNTHPWQAGKTYQVHEEQANVPAFKAVVESVPKTVSMPKFLAAAVAVCPPIVLAANKKDLTSEVLDSWLQTIDKSSRYAVVEVEQSFKRFPTDSYTKENVKLAIKNTLLSKVPEHLVTDDSHVTALTVGYSNNKHIDWDKITPEIIIAALKKDAYHTKWSLREAPVSLLSDPRVATAMCEQVGHRSGVLGISAKDVAETFKDPATRKHWTAEQYEYLSGEAIPLEDIPQKFWTDAVVGHALKTRAETAQLLDDPAEFMNKHDVRPGHHVMVALMANGLAPVNDKWVNARDLKHNTVKGVDGYYVVTPVEPQGHVLFLFEGDKCVEAILSGYEQGDHWSRKYFASNYSDVSSKDNIKTLWPLRKLIVDALDRYAPDLADVKSNHSFESRMKQIRVFKEKGFYTLVEKMTRTLIGGLAFVEPGQRDYGYGSTFFLFDGEKGKLIGAAMIDSDARGSKLTSFQMTDGSMPRWLEHSGDVAEFIRKENCIAGTSSTFMATDLYKRLGIRGPGKRVWYSLLQKKLTEHGDLSLWEADTEKGKRYTLVHKEFGTLVTGKRWKDGTFQKEFLVPEAQERYKIITDFMDEMAKKIPN